MAKLARHKLVKCKGDDTYKQLSERAKTTKAPTTIPKALKLADIHVAPKVFQWRRSGRNLVLSEEHTLELARVIQDGDTELPPLLVFLIGERFYVLDGHHRLDAYHSVGWKKRVPVKVFDGTLERARATALQLNSRNKLPMTHEDKREAAWELTKNHQGMMSIEDTAVLSTVSKRTVSYMRKAWKELCDRAGTDDVPDSIEEMRESLSWRNARWTLQGIRLPNNEDWKDAEVEKMAELLMTHVGYKLMRNPDITAEALRKLSPELPRALIHEWAGEEAATIKELAERNEEEIDF